MKKNLNLFISGTIITFSLVFSYFVVASNVNAEQISFPVKELSNCKNESECKSFCDNKANVTACVNFAEKNGLMSKEDAAQAKKFAQTGNGPGGCKSQGECESYCNNIDNMDQCLDFASKNGLVSSSELVEAKKIAKILKEGGKLPGGCKNKSDCENFCNDLDNVGECFDFAEKAGFIPSEEIDDARKAVKAMKEGAKPPGGCKNKKECDNYCSDSEHVEECLGFAEKAGFIPKEEVEQARKIIPLMKAGKMPGGCKDKASCDSYCKDDAHVEECGNFAIEAGFMKPEEAEMFKKTGGKGPGGCKGKNECESFCNDPANQEQCFKFASEKGLIPEAQVKEMKEGMAQFQQGLGMATPEIIQCIKDSVGEDKFEKMKSGGIPDRSVGEAMGQCFTKLMKGGPGGAGGPPAGFENMKGPPSAEDIQKMIPKGVDVSPEMLKKGPPSAEDIQKMLPKGVEVTPEMMKNGPPSQEQIQNIIQQKIKEQMEKSGAPSGGGSFGPPAGTNFGPPAGIPGGPPAGF